ncbi:MAG: HAMP domain-containing histidine kinase, partial [Archaeoglobales archaeon]|nr:HAMP domain-containing histidine kinase [Archaeoglobales archaeon]
RLSVVNIDGNATVLANEGIYVVFDNLISNSIKHGKATKIFIKIKEGSSKILLEFLDNGNGVPAEIGDKIFEKGFSTSKSTGLGLYIVKKLLESYGGNVS